MVGLNKEYFHELLQAKDSVRALVLSAIRQMVTNEDNIQLTAIEEFREAMFSMQLDKCPGPNGIKEILRCSHPNDFSNKVKSFKSVYSKTDLKSLKIK